MKNVLCQTLAGCRRLHHAVAGESIDQIKVGNIWVLSDDCIVIDVVVLVAATPVIDQLQPIQALHMGSQIGPDSLFKEGNIYIVIKAKLKSECLPSYAHDTSRSR